MCVCNHTYNEPKEMPFRGLSNRPRFFQWMTIVLLTGWVLIVSLAASNAHVDGAVSSPPLQSLIETFL